MKRHQAFALAPVHGACQTRVNPSLVPALETIIWRNCFQTLLALLSIASGAPTPRRFTVSGTIRFSPSLEMPSIPKEVTDIEGWAPSH